MGNLSIKNAVGNLYLSFHFLLGRVGEISTGKCYFRAIAALYLTQKRHMVFPFYFKFPCSVGLTQQF